MSQQHVMMGVGVSLELEPGAEVVICASTVEQLQRALPDRQIGVIRHVVITPGQEVGASPIIRGPGPEEFARELDGCQYMAEVGKLQEAALKSAGLVAAFGYSDDLIEFRGAIHDEVTFYEGQPIKLLASGKVADEEAMECLLRCISIGAIPELPGMREIQAEWHSDDGPCWTFKTEIPHATFMIHEGSDSYCRGIIFRLSDIQ